MIKVFNSYVGTEVKVNNFDFFVSICKYVAEKLQTLEEHRDFPEHRFGRVIFETDRFGGTYADFSFKHDSGAVLYAAGTAEQEQIFSLERLIEIVKVQRSRLEKVRDLAAISAHINAEY